MDTLRTMLEGLSREDTEDLKVLAQNVHDPMSLGLMVALLIEERRRTNRLLEEILEEIRKAKPVEEKKEIMGLSEQDERILELARERGSITAEEVKEALGYKGLNGASARLNYLFKQGYLRKIRKGRKVYFMLA